MTTYASENYEITVADGTEIINGHECYSGQLILTQPQGTEVFDTFTELVEAHPVCEEARNTFESTEYRFENGKLFRFDENSNAYIFCFSSIYATDEETAVRMYESRNLEVTG